MNKVEPGMIETLKIDSPRAAAAFAHPQSRRIVLALIAEPRSLRELEEETGLSLSLLHYHVGRLCALGLIAVVGEDRRAGRPVKRYRATAKRFFVPAALASGDAGEALGRELRAGLERDRARRDDAGVEYFLDPEGRPRMSRVRGEAEAHAFELWLTLSLTTGEARSLAEEVRAVFDRYAGRTSPGARPVLAYWALAQRG